MSVCETISFAITEISLAIRSPSLARQQGVTGQKNGRRKVNCAEINISQQNSNHLETSRFAVSDSKYGNRSNKVGPSKAVLPIKGVRLTRADK